ncbi:inorganic pyrophosphatase [Plasmodium inui San Antonio 1]|uniref:inorganic diphosphatase n=1 Tax=Plasmodium inui San Antonio 1 TaxID=1237626 RepID=W6ZWZ4_9APIC|nr:inorganic pyrophosphatase [Plasmodium inui San Antonio 1]EUD63795.1 inorganic pyrophosphatase [Plasmodium inui San Antonio 1]
MSSAVMKPSNGEMPKRKEVEKDMEEIEEEVKNEYQVETNKELQVNLNFHNNNIISNIFSNLSLFDYITNIFTINEKTYMLKYCNKLNEDNFYISYFQKVNDKFAQISPWHDIDLVNEDGTYNMVVEITKYNYIKLEIQLTENFNVIKQDTKKGKLRYYHNSIYWNYGALPRTYEYPKHIYSCQTGDNQDLFFTGDDDPLDVVDVGQNSLKMGQIVPVKVLGAFTLIDEGQLDWKIIAINKYDKHFDDVNSLEDVQKYYPSTLNMLLEWFRSYKMAESKKLNIISKKLYNKEESEGLIQKTHEYYCEFLRDVKNLECDQSSQSTCGNSTKQHSGSSDLSSSTLPKKSQDDSLYKSLLQDISISYHMPDTTYRPNENIWIH